MMASLGMATLAWLVSTTPYAGAATEPFDRAACAEYILGNGGARLKDERLRWLRSYAPIVLAPTNHRAVAFRVEDMDEHFVDHQARHESPAARAALVRDARARFDTYKRTRPDGPLPSTALTPLQAAALGVDAPGPRPVDTLTTYLVAKSDGGFALESYDEQTQIGGVILDANEVRVGYRGDPAYWVYDESRRDFDDQRDLKPGPFLDEVALLAFRVERNGRAFVYTIEAREAGEDLPWTAVNIEIYSPRAVHPALVEEDILQIPRAAGPAERLTSVGLRLDRFVPANED